MTSLLPVVDDDELDEPGVLPDVLADALADDDGLFVGLDAGLVDAVDA
jgi:hypothetical protein